MSEQPRLPKVGEFVRACGRLVEIQDVTPKPPAPTLDYIFEYTNARVEGRINGKVIKTFSTFNDLYGEGTCVKYAIEEAQSQAKWYGPSDMVFVVVKITSRVRKRPIDRENLYDARFRGFESLSFGCGHNLPKDVEEDVWFSNAQNDQEALVGQ
jgi:hypothetical protein